MYVYMFVIVEVSLSVADLWKPTGFSPSPICQAISDIGAYWSATPLKLHICLKLSDIKNVLLYDKVLLQ